MAAGGGYTLAQTVVAVVMDPAVAVELTALTCVLSWLWLSAPAQGSGAGRRWFVPVGTEARSRGTLRAPESEEGRGSV